MPGQPDHSSKINQKRVNKPIPEKTLPIITRSGTYQEARLWIVFPLPFFFFRVLPKVPCVILPRFVRRSPLPT